VAIKEPSEVQKKNNVWENHRIREIEYKEVWVRTVSLSGLPLTLLICLE